MSLRHKVLFINDAFCPFIRVCSIKCLGFIVCMCVGSEGKREWEHVNIYVSQQTHGGQRTTCEGQFFPSMWVPEIELSLTNLYSSIVPTGPPHCPLGFLNSRMNLCMGRQSCCTYFTDAMLGQRIKQTSYRNQNHLLSYLAAIWRDGASDFNTAMWQHKLSRLWLHILSH